MQLSDICGDGGKKASPHYFLPSESRYLIWREKHVLEKKLQRKIYTWKTQSENGICSQQACSSHLTVRIQLFTSASSFNVFAATQTTINKWKRKGNISLRTRIWFNYHVIRGVKRQFHSTKKKWICNFYSWWFFHWRRKEVINVIIHMKVTIVSNRNLKYFQCSEKILKEKTIFFSFNKQSE